MKKLMRILFVLALLFSTISLNVKVGAENAYSTEDTFISNGGEYSIEYILSNVGIFVEGNASSIHNNSPVIIGGSFGRFSDSQSIKNIKNGLEFDEKLLERVQTHDAIEFIENVPSYIGGTALIAGVQAHKNFYFGTENAVSIVEVNDSESSSKYKINSNIDQSQVAHIVLKSESKL